ncbi:aconitate hydratase AcnA [Streptomyces ipomoeae]|uniref:aconitate hydratase AcnA n=1 Tax=Streptomyces ipomoeae TaxID=103232 RepID=UPI001146BC4C|nr:aconitate hydratase AcnA [Streptomyces ipomoeae]MDX2939363.1 aconitate hydratase AcnA [Streptomyces ipomoeae]TQE25206.1 aconitate hydratase AcnA [Streptomyces ipomoeae]
MNADRTAVLTVEGRSYGYQPLDRILRTAELDALPYAIRVLLENVARRAPEALAGVVSRARAGSGACEVPVHPNRIMLHDTTCLPALADFAALRDSVAELGGDPERLQPSIPVDLTVDHSVIVEEYGRADAVERNLLIDFRRNGERYEMVKWAERSVRNFRVVPPGTGIIHQVNMEALARVVWQDTPADGGPPMLHPDLLVATDSHTPMINALGVVGWGVGGLEGQAAMLGEPVTIPYPDVVGVRLTGKLRQGVGATDLALTLTELLRATGVVNKFVEFCGDGVTTLGWAERAAVSNMAPEYGATCVYFPYDDEAAAYLRLSGREEEHVRLVDAYLTAQGLKRTDDRPVPHYDQLLDLDLGTVEPSVAGPNLPHQRLPLSRVPASFRQAGGRTTTEADMFGEPLPDGPVAIASITSCTNTANPALIVRAGLIAERAVRAGLTAKPWVKTSLSPGSRVVEEYLREAGLLPALEKTGFHIVGFGCMTCIGNSGPLHPAMEDLAEKGATEPVAVLSGNRNFAGRVNPRVSLSYLASPPLVVAYALAGSVLHDFDDEPLGTDHEGCPVFLRDLWPSDEEVASCVAEFVRPEMFRANAARIRQGTQAWQEIEAPGGTRFPWNPESTYIRRPPHLTDLTAHPPTRLRIDRARVLLLLGDDVTTDHISPAGAIPARSAAGQWLTERGVARRDLNQYSTRRSNHEVMLRGAFTNAAVTNLLLDHDSVARSGPGGHARTADGAHVLPVHQAAPTYREAGHDLVVVAGRNYGAGSSRDWAAKAQALLGVRAVIAESYERIHRSNLIGMGVLPLEFAEGDHASSYPFTGEQELSFEGLDGLTVGTNRVTLHLRGPDGRHTTAGLRLRVFSRQELEYLRHGGILPYVVRRALASS